MSRRRHGRSRQVGRTHGDAPRPVGGRIPPAPSASVETPDVASDPAPAVRPAPVVRAAPTNGDASATGAAPPPVSTLPTLAGPPSNGCTAPQLRRFIKSRPYVPMHELRRRFGINGSDDDVTQVRIDRGAIYVGLPEREGALLGELLRGGEIGYELSLDPRSPIVIGVYPMRPVPRG